MCRNEKRKRNTMHIRRAWNTWGKRKENNINSGSSNIGCNKKSTVATRPQHVLLIKKRFTVLYKTRSVYRYFSDLYSPPQLQTLLVADLAEKDNITISTAAAEIYFHFHTRHVFASVSVPVCMHILSWRVRDRSHRVHRLFTSLRASSLSCSYIHFHPSKYVISGIRIDKS